MLKLLDFLIRVGEVLFLKAAWAGAMGGVWLLRIELLGQICYLMALLLQDMNVYEGLSYFVEMTY